MLLEIDIQSYWHAGSGQGDGPGADALVIRTKEQLPYFPGKTLNGLLRDACELAEKLGHIESNTTSRLFGMGRPIDGKTPKTAKEGEGCIVVNNAYMGKTSTEQHQWKNWATQYPDAIPLLFKIIHSTTIDDDGVAKDKSLRSIEYSIPMKLYAKLELSNKETENLRLFLPLIKELGLRRRRGFGRCSMKLIEA